jgi:hypothetical protein
MKEVAAAAWGERSLFLPGVFQADALDSSSDGAEEDDDQRPSEKVEFE